MNDSEIMSVESCLICEDQEATEEVEGPNRSHKISLVRKELGARKVRGGGLDSIGLWNWTENLLHHRQVLQVVVSLEEGVACRQLH